MRQEPFIPIYDLTDSSPDDTPTDDYDEPQAGLDNKAFTDMLDAILNADIKPFMPFDYLIMGDML